jgi:small subunit ribosomal protein S3
MKTAVSKVANGKEVNINVIEIKTPDLNAQLVAESIATQLDQRVVCRRAMKQAIARCQKAGVKGIKVMCSGRINNAEIARSETLHFGSIPLQTLRADIDYGFAEATIYGRLGVKVWIYKGEILGKVNLARQSQGGKN